MFAGNNYLKELEYQSSFSVITFNISSNTVTPKVNLCVQSVQLILASLCKIRMLSWSRFTW